jgi:histidine triad (HIT) family protein
MSPDNSCIFCSIINKSIPAKIIAENDYVMAFHDLNPVAPTHVLIIPKTHIRSLNNISSEHKDILAEILLFVPELAKKLSINNHDGYRLVINTEAHAGQSVFHLHVHLLAGRDFSWPPG